MQVVPEGPDQDRIRAQMLQRMREHEQEVLGRRPVFGLESSALGPGFWARSDSQSVTLFFGETASPSGPLVSVTTFGGKAIEARTVNVQLLMDDEHDRIRDHAHVDDPPWTNAVAVDGEIVVDGRLRRARIYQDDVLTAAVILLPEATVIAVARGLPVTQLKLVAVADLQPFLDRRKDWIAQRASVEAGVPPEQMDLPPANGVQAHRLLIEQTVAVSAAAIQRVTRRAIAERGDVKLPEPVRTSRASNRAVIWESALRAQMHLAGQDRASANEAITSLANHMSRLSRSVPWWDYPAVRFAAIEESIGYTVFAAPVASTPAQQAWQEAWQAQAVPVEAWLTAWTQWEHARGG